MKEVSEIIKSDPPQEKTEEKKSEGKHDFTNLISEVTKFKEKGCALYKEKKIEEAKGVFKEGIDAIEKESPIINKERETNEQCKEILLLSKKILSNIALCYYKQGKYKESIEYDLKIIQNYPNFGKSIVRLFNAYSRLNQLQQAACYGDLFLELEKDVRDKFKGTQEKVQEAKKKLKEIQKKEKDKIKKDFTKYGIPVLVLLLAALTYFLLRKNK